MNVFMKTLLLASETENEELLRELKKMMYECLWVKLR